MADNVQNATLEVLKRIQEDIASLRNEMREGFARTEEIGRKQRRDVAGILVMMKATAGDFDERVTAIENRMDALEAQRS